jgi:hypothetical protein
MSDRPNFILIMTDQQRQPGQQRTAEDNHAAKSVIFQ